MQALLFGHPLQLTLTRCFPLFLAPNFIFTSHPFNIFLFILKLLQEKRRHIWNWLRLLSAFLYLTPSRRCLLPFGFSITCPGCYTLKGCGFQDKVIILSPKKESWITFNGNRPRLYHSVHVFCGYKYLFLFHSFLVPVPIQTRYYYYNERKKKFLLWVNYCVTVPIWL